MAKKAASKKKTTKRKVSGKRGTAARRKSAAPVEVRGVIGIAVLCLGLLALACQFIPSSGGFLNQCVLLVRGLGGTLCLLLPLMVCWAGVTLVFFSSRRMSVRTMICGALLFLFVETIFQLMQVGQISASLLADGREVSYPGFLARSYRYDSYNCVGGGLIGALLAWPLYCALDVWGGVVALVFACVMVLMVLTGVSFTSLGMSLSEALDDWRVQRREKREEREALRSAREEKALEEERVLAEQRREKRAAREKAERERIEREEAARRAAEEAAQQAQPGAQAGPAEEEQPPAKGRKGRAKLTVLEPQMPEPSPEPVFAQESAPAPKRSAPARRTKRSGDAPLYIERSDEFERAGIDERRDVHERRRRPAFTMQEAENEFLYGMNATPPQEAAQAPAAHPEYDPNAQYAHPEYDPNVQYAQPGYDPNAQYIQLEEPEPPETPDYTVSTEPDDLPWDDAPAPDAEEIAPDAGFTPFSAGSYTPPSSIPARGVPARREATAQREETARREANANPVDVTKPRQLTFAEQDAAAGEKVITQLRGSRPDGTPLVMPQRETHAAPPPVEETYMYPPIDLLNRSNATQDPNLNAKIEQGSRKLLATLESFGVQAKLTHVTHGPAITRYELQPAPGVKVSRIVGLVDDIALNMAADGVRIEAPIPGKPAVGIEIPNEKIETVSLRDVLESPEMTRQKSPTAVALGKGISGTPVVADMAKMPHVLIAGATGSGKSVCINTIINSIIYRASPKEVRLILIDPKVVELSVYNGIPHLLVPVVTDPKKASAALSWAVVEMEHRYKRFETMGVRNIEGYNHAIGPDEEPMSKIIVIIDELADLMMVAPGEVEESICRLAQLARAAGIHLVIATQRPSVNVITGVIKANIPSRIAFAVSSQIDSRTILDAGGAEKLLGKGDMLYAPQGAGKPTRVQGCFVSDDEVQRIVDYVRGKHEADYNEDVIEQMNSAAEEEKAAAGDVPAGGEAVDEMLSKAIDLAVEAGQVSISMLQRRLRVGYARAGRLVDEMTLRGITAEAEGPTKPRTVLISREEWRRMQENGE